MDPWAEGWQEVLDAQRRDLKQLAGEADELNLKALAKATRTFIAQSREFSAALTKHSNRKGK